jgi:hypothetical protein
MDPVHESTITSRSGLVVVSGKQGPQVMIPINHHCVNGQAMIVSAERTPLHHQLCRARGARDDEEVFHLAHGAFNQLAALESSATMDA